MSSRKPSPPNNDQKVRVKRPFGRNLSIDELVGDDNNGGPSELGRALEFAVTVPKIKEPDQDEKQQVLAAHAAKKANSKLLVLDVPIDSLIEIDGNQPRTKIDEEHVAELCRDFSKTGQTTPILVRKSDTAIGSYEVIAGHHRIEAAKRLGWSHISANLLSITAEKARVLSLTDNDLQLAVYDYDRGRHYKSLLDDGVFSSQSALAEAFGKTQAHVSQCLAFMDLPEPIKAILNEKPSLFTYRTAVDIKQLLKEYADDSGNPTERSVAVATEGVRRLLDGKPSVSLIPWIRHTLSGKTLFQSKTDPLLVTDTSGREVFRTRCKDRAVVVEWDKKNDFSADDIQKAIIEALKSLANDNAPATND